MNTSSFSDPSDQPLVVSARLELLADTFDDGAEVNNARGTAAAVLFADAGIPVFPRHPWGFQPLAEPSADLHLTVSRFELVPGAVVGYDAAESPMCVLTAENSHALQLLVAASSPETAPGVLASKLRAHSQFFPAGAPVVRVLAAEASDISFIDNGPNGTVRYDAPRAVRPAHNASLPLGLAIQLAHNPFLRDMVRGLFRGSA